jgi:hypothetical protein
MSNSKHVEEILGVFRNHTLVAVTKAGKELEVLFLDPYPEETNSVIGLGNGKKITTDDLEFADLAQGEAQIKVLLGDYTFHLERGKAN